MTKRFGDPAQAAQREAERQVREDKRRDQARRRQQALDEKEEKRRYLEARSREVDEKNRELEKRVQSLKEILAHTLAVDDYLDLDFLKRKLVLPAIDLSSLGVEPTAPRENDYLLAAPGFFARLLPGWRDRYEAAEKAARSRFGRDSRVYEARVADRQRRIAAIRAQHDAEVKRLRYEVGEQHKQIEAFKAQFASARPDAVVKYFSLVLQRSEYPPGFPKTAKLAFVPESKQLVVEYELPPFDVVPRTRTYKYNKSKDDLSETLRPATERRELYASLVAQITIRTVHEVFEADRKKLVQSTVFNGHVNTIDAATGKRVRPCVISLRSTREVFEEIELRHVDPVACLGALNAAISKRPEELIPVRPVLEFSMVDPRFVKEADVLSGLDKRPNLMELTPSEFESLITNLFTRMGLEARQTQASRDGGVDCVAYDPRPIFGGKVIIQAKRYKHTVGVSAVRDLFGTLQNEGASKGILVTTSGYGKAAFDFADGKPLELLSGSNLLYLLSEHAGIEAKIVPPENWKDPAADASGPS